MVLIFIFINLYSVIIVDNVIFERLFILRVLRQIGGYRNPISGIVPTPLGSPWQTHFCLTYILSNVIFFTYTFFFF
jgi:hypothetical protein